MAGRADAHFLHAARPLESVLAPSIESPRALSWVPGKEVLLVSAADGGLHSVEPVWGVRHLFNTHPEAAHLSTHDERAAVLGRDGHLEIWHVGERKKLWEAETPMVSQMGVRWWSGGVAVAGDDFDQRRLIVFDDDGCVKVRARLPPRTALGVSPLGRLLVARSSVSGLHVAALGKPIPADQATGHTLRFAPGGRVLGVVPTGVTIWSARGAAPITVKMTDTTAAALHPDGSVLALGTRTGAVAVAAAIAGSGMRANPSRVEGHSGPVQMMSYAPKGRWLATMADGCRVWSY